MNYLLNKQKEYFNTGKTLDIRFRKENLLKLKKSIINNEKELLIAFEKDFNKGSFDVLTTELGLVIKEINYMLSNIDKLNKKKRVITSIVNFPSKGYILKEPYGVVLIVSPWNYPFQLTLVPLIGSMAAGNCSIVKPSDYSYNVSLVIEKILGVFDESYIKVVLGGRKENEELFTLKYDYVFFTGSTNVGKIIMASQSQYLTPMTLELGGKSPCIVDEDANIDVAARRIVWGKYLNAGQTCVAPDYILVHKNIKEKFKIKVFEYINEFYYTNNLISLNFPHIINEKHLIRLNKLIDNKKVVFGGKIKNKLIEPIVMDNVKFEDAVMQEEIFGPIMPLIEFDDLKSVIKDLKTKPKPLAFYYFGENKIKQNFVLNNCSFGGGCINEVIMHLSEEKLPFGGIGDSGFGSYHGKKSFQTFSHEKSILKKTTKFELKIKYPPYNYKKQNLIKKIFKMK